MASTTTKGAPAKGSLPINLLPTDLARIVSQAHPALLLAAYYIRFPAFVADPIATLLSSLLPLAIIQIAYATICLPPTGSSMKPMRKPKIGAPKPATDAPPARPLVCSLSLLSLQRSL